VPRVYELLVVRTAMGRGVAKVASVSEEEPRSNFAKSEGKITVRMCLRLGQSAKRHRVVKARTRRPGALHVYRLTFGYTKNTSSDAILASEYMRFCIDTLGRTRPQYSPYVILTKK
jgi:hypothetical protein